MPINLSRLTAREPAADHVGSKASGNVTGAEGAACKVGCLAELVGSGEGQGVHNGENESDDDEGQPEELQLNQGEDEHEHPQHGLDVEGEPEEAAVGGGDDLCAGLAALKDPVGVARLGVDFVPPAQADEATAGDVLEVVEVAGEEEDGDDEDHDHAVYYPETKEVDEDA